MRNSPGSNAQIPFRKGSNLDKETWTKKQLIFATAEKPIVRIVHNQVDTGETGEMDKRWVYIQFTHQIFVVAHRFQNFGVWSESRQGSSGWVDPEMVGGG